MTTDPNELLLHHYLASPLVTRLARWFGISWYEITAAPLLGVTEWDLYDIRGIGATYTKAIKDFLAEYGLALKPNPNTTEEIYLWDGERTRLHRFGQWMLDHPDLQLDESLHQFLINENKRSR